MSGPGIRVYGTLRQAMFTGRELQLSVELAGHGMLEALTAPSEAMVALKAGDDVVLGLHASDLQYFAPGATGARLA